MYLNKVLLYGNLTRDPELRALPSGIQVATIGIATNRVFRDKNGQKQEQTEYHTVVVFGRQAETSAQYLKKGAPIFVEGRLQTRSWEKDGQKHYRTEVVADRVQFGPRTGGAGGAGSYDAGARPQGSKAQDIPDDGGAGIDYPEEAINPDDIPF